MMEIVNESYEEDSGPELYIDLCQSNTARDLGYDEGIDNDRDEDNGDERDGEDTSESFSSFLNVGREEECRRIVPSQVYFAVALNGVPAVRRRFGRRSWGMVYGDDVVWRRCG